MTTYLFHSQLITLKCTDVFRLLCLLLMAIVMLMLSWNTLRGRLASVRMKRHGLALADETGHEIDLNALNEIASSLSFRPSGAHFNSTAH